MGGLGGIFWIIIGTIIKFFNLNYPILNSRIARGLICFFIGGLCFYLEDSIEKKKYNKEISLLSIWILIPFCINYTKMFQSYWNLVFIVSPIILLLSLNSEMVKKILSNKILVFGGKISFSIYLMQYPLMLFIYFLDRCEIIKRTTNKCFLIYWVLLFLTSIIVYYRIEIPCARGIRKTLLSRNK